MVRLAPCLALALVGASLARPASASVWSVPGVLGAPSRDSPESLLEQAQQAYDDGRYRESGDLATAAYGALPLDNRASPYGENAVFAATNAYRESWLREGDAAVLEAAAELLRRHIGDYDERGRRSAPSTVKQELERMELLLARCRPEPGPDAEGVEPPPVAVDVDPEPSTKSTPTRPLRRAAAAAFTGDAALSLGAGMLSLYVFGYQPSAASPDILEQVRSVGHLVPALPLSVGAAVVGGLGMHAFIDGGGVSVERRRKIGVGLTVAGAATLLAGAVLLSTGAAFWPAPENGVTSESRANWSVNLQSVGLAITLGSLGIVGPGIAALATPGKKRR